MADPTITVEMLLEDQQFKRRMTRTIARVSNQMRTLSQSISRTQDARQQFGGLQKGLKGVAAVATKAVGVIGRMAAMMAKLGAVAGAVGAGLAVWATKVANDVDRAAWKFGIVFREMGQTAVNTAQIVADSYGRHLSTIQTSMARIADVLKPVGVTEQVALGISAAIAELSEGASEWTAGQYDAATASIAFTKALVGEREMLKEMGIVIREADVTGYIEAMGWAYNEANKMAATFNLILMRSQDMQRGVGTRLQTFGERVKQLQEALKGMAATIGSILMPVMNSALTLATTLADKFAEFAASGASSQLRTFLGYVAGQLDRISSIIAGLRPQEFISGLTTMLSQIFGAMIDVIDIILDHIRNSLLSIGREFGSAIVEGIQASELVSRVRETVEDLTLKFFKGPKAGRATSAIIPTAPDSAADTATKLANRLNRMVDAIGQQLPGRGRPSLATGRGGFGASRIEEQLSLEDGRIKARIGETERLIKTLTGKLITNQERMETLQERRAELMMPPDRRIQLQDISSAYESALTAAAGKDQPNKQIAKNTEDMRNQSQEQTKLQRQLVQAQEQLIQLEQTRRATYTR